MVLCTVALEGTFERRVGSLTVDDRSRGSRAPSRRATSAPPRIDSGPLFSEVHALIEPLTQNQGLSFEPFTVRLPDSAPGGSLWLLVALRASLSRGLTVP